MKGEKKKVAKNNDDICAIEECCLGCLPVELVVIILSYLSVVDRISFRCVCKCWRSAFSKCPPRIPQQRWGLPWFVLLRIQEDGISDGKFGDQPPLLYTTGKFGDLSTQRIYTTRDNVLGDSQFLLSKHGWLLLFSVNLTNTLFFFNLISRKTIDLPYLKEERFCKAERSPVFDISAPPTSSECMVFVINWGVGQLNYEISTCSLGDTEWKTKVYESCILSTVPRPVSVVYGSKMWFCLHESGYISVFDAVKFNWKDVVKPKSRCSYTSNAYSPVFYVMKYGDQLHLHVHDGQGYEVVLKEPLEANSIKRSEGTTWMMDFEFSFRTCFKDALVQLQQQEGQHQLQVDSFNAHAWCTPCDVVDSKRDDKKSIEFHWHRFRSFVDTWYQDNKRCPKDNNCYIVAWLQPDDSILSSSLPQPWVAP